MSTFFIEESIAAIYLKFKLVSIETFLFALACIEIIILIIMIILK